MYDNKREPREFVAENRDEAVAEAARFFGVEVHELRISGLEGTAVHGLAGRALVVAAPASAPRIESSGDDGDRGGRGDRDRRGGRDRGERGERGGRDRGGRGRDRDRDRDRDRRDRSRSEEPAAAAAPARPVGPSKGTARGELAEVGRFLLGAIERMQLGPFEIEQASDGDFLIYQLRGDAIDQLSSGDGRALDALQMLANQAALQQDADAPRVIVDADGRSEKREEFLGRLADRAAKRATETGRTVALDPMSPKDRRIIHVALRDAAGIATMSEGSGRYRQVLVVPEGAPEYEEAMRAGDKTGS